MQILFKFQVNRMKIDNFRNSAYVDLLAYGDLKMNRWLNSVTGYANALQISGQWMKIDNFRNSAYVDLKINRWLNSVTGYANALQISS